MVLWAFSPFSPFSNFTILQFTYSLTSFVNSLLFILILTSLTILYFFSRYCFPIPNNLITIYIFAFTLGQFAYLENLKQRNIEITEFSLICLAILVVKFKNNWLLAVSLSLAFLSKLLPFIFFPYLIIKKQYKAITIYLIVVVVITIITEFVLGWSNWWMLESKNEHGVPSAEVFLGEKPLAAISHVRGSFYTFILAFFSETHLTNIATVVYKKEYFSLINWGYIAFCFIISCISFRFIYHNKTDTLFDFAIITSLMLLVFPRINPHYYIFCLFGFYFLLHAFLSYRQDIVSLKTSYKSLLSIWFVVISMLLGEFIPFSIIDRIIDQDFNYFDFMSTYGLQGLGTFLLWFLIIIVGPEKRNEKQLIS
jgi:hypothetical protein